VKIVIVARLFVQGESTILVQLSKEVLHSAESGKVQQTERFMRRTWNQSRSPNFHKQYSL